MGLRRLIMLALSLGGLMSVASASSEAAVRARFEGETQISWPSQSGDQAVGPVLAVRYDNDATSPRLVDLSVATALLPDGSALYGLRYQREVAIQDAVMGYGSDTTDSLACESGPPSSLLGAERRTLTSFATVQPGGAFEFAVQIVIEGGMAPLWPGVSLSPGVSVTERTVGTPRATAVTTPIQVLGPSVSRIEEPGTQTTIRVRRETGGRYRYRVSTNPAVRRQFTLEAIDQKGRTVQRIRGRLGASGRATGTSALKRSARWIRASLPRVVGRHAASWSCPVSLSR